MAMRILACALSLALAGCSPLIGLIVEAAESGSAELRTGSSVRGSTRDASDAFQPGCGAPAGAGDRVFVFRPERSGIHRFDLAGNYDCVLGLYDDTGRGLDCNDDSGSVSHSMITRDLEVGRTYLLVADGYGSARGDFELRAVFVSAPAPAPPGLVSNAPPVQLAGALAPGQAAQGDTRGGADRVTPPCGSRPGSPDQSWTFTPPRTGTYQLQVDADYDSVLAIYRPGSPTPIGCNDDHGSTRVSRVVTQLDVGVSYEVVVDGFGGASGTYVLRANELVSTPPGVLPVAQLVRGDTNAGSDTQTPSCGSVPGSNDQVWTFTAPADGMYRLDVASEYDAVLALYGPSGELACNDDFTSTRDSRLEFTLRAGQSYRVVIDGYQGGQGAYQLQVTALTVSGQVLPTPPLPPPSSVEDIGALEGRCASAPILGSGRTNGSFGSDSHARLSCALSPGSERIYREQVQQRARLGVQVQGQRQPAIELRSGCSRGHSVLICDPGRGSMAALATLLDPGTYYLVVDSRVSDGDDTFALDVSITPASP
jgi:hypothetical protein